MFKEIQKQVQQNLAKIDEALFTTDPDREKIWEVYLAAFKEADRQENTCNCCKSFLRQYGGIVGIKDGKKVSLWDFEPTDEMYKAPIAALKKYIHSLPIKNIFLNDVPNCGTEKNRDTKRGIYWEHFSVKLPSKFVKKDAGPTVAAALDNKNVLERSLKEITDDAVDTVLELIGQNSLYRGQEFKGMLTEFSQIRERHKKFKGDKQSFYWLESAKASPAVTRIRNSSIGTLLNDLSEGKELDVAVAAFERVVAPTNYKRPTALATPKMIDAAKKRLEELQLLGSLKRRVLSTRDLTAENALFVHRVGYKELDVFDQLKKDVTVNPKTFSKVDEVSICDFVEKVLPTAKSVKLLLENSQLGNFVTLVGPQDKNDPSMFKWGNNFSWSYTGNVADSMRTRVIELGGRVDGVLRFTHSWNHPEVGRNASLMDLHVFLPGSTPHQDGCHDIYQSGQRVGWNNRNDYASGGTQDVDYTDAAPEGHVPIENITFPSMKKLKDGKYVFKIHNWNLRTPTNSGFKAEIEFNGELFQYNYPKPLKHKEWITLAEVTLKNGVFTIDHKLDSKEMSQEKWGLRTSQFHRVKAVTVSPNYWTGAVGNKHYFFLLDNCVSDETPRGFYNEMLKEDLMQDRKVFEMLAGKVEVEKTEDELSGVGFSDTLKTSVILQVEGAFKRVIKVNF